MEEDNLEKLRERAVAFGQALREFFKVASIAVNLYITYSEETT
jgi:hypothetical protein